MTDESSVPVIGIPLADAALSEKLLRYREEMARDVEEKDAKLNRMLQGE